MRLKIGKLDMASLVTYQYFCLPPQTLNQLSVSASGGVDKVLVMVDRLMKVPNVTEGAIGCPTIAIT
jgi:hypothetical protein